MNDTVPPFKITYLKPLEKKLPYMFVDFDYTISDFGRMKDKIRDNCLEIGIGKNIWDKTYDESKNSTGVYDNQKHIQILAKLYPKITQQICDAFYNEFENAVEYKYADVDEFLGNFAKNFNIILLTLGDEDFQFVKRESSDVDKYFRAAINTSDSKVEAVKYIFENKFFPTIQNVVFVDDKSEYFQNFRDLILSGDNEDLRYEFIWINRPGAKYSDILPKGDIVEEIHEIKDLREISNIIFEM